MNAELAQAIRAMAQSRGISPRDVATVMSYETAGTFDPWKAGPTTQWGQHRGLIQWGGPQREQYGIYQGMPITDQVNAIGRYFDNTGVKPGMGLMDLYSAVNAGRVGRYNASDANNGGAPGTVADKVNYQMAGHAANADRLLGTTPDASPPTTVAIGQPAQPQQPAETQIPLGLAGAVTTDSSGQTDQTGQGSDLLGLLSKLGAGQQQQQPTTAQDSGSQPMSLARRAFPRISFANIRMS